MKKFEILWELPKCDTEIWSEQMLFGKMAVIRLFRCRVAINLQFVKKKKKKQYLQSTVKQGKPVFWSRPHR